MYSVGCNGGCFTSGVYVEQPGVCVGQPGGVGHTLCGGRRGSGWMERFPACAGTEHVEVVGTWYVYGTHACRLLA